MNQIAKRFEGTVLVSDLPPIIRDKLGLAPDEEVCVTVETSRDRRERLKAVMARIGASSEANGLTEEIFDAIVNER